MIENSPRKIIIVGGGTAGWMTAAALAHFLSNKNTELVLVESEQIGTVGVGEATLPHLRFFNQTLGIDEKEFMRETHATFKLGIEFSNWGEQNQAYIHPFGDYGKPINDISFHHFWLKYRQDYPDSSLDDFSYGVSLAKQHRFKFPSNDLSSIESSYSYAYHVDAGLYAKYLRSYAEKKGVTRVEGIIKDCQFNQNGTISSVSLKGGQQLSADFFIDCSGFRALLIGEALKQPFQSWKHWLPCDRAIAVPTENRDSMPPYTKAIAHSAGWRWQIPLQHRNGNGIVFASDYFSDDEANNLLDQQLPESTDSQRISLSFEAGTRQCHWVKNCVAIGLSSGFLEPLESTSIYLIQSAIMKLVEFMPGNNEYQLLREEFNRQMDNEIIRIRDFLILHYHMTERNDSEFWQYCKTMEIPESLQQKIDLFKQTSHIESYQHGLFLEPSWLAVYIGQGCIPTQFNRIADNVNRQKLQRYFSDLKATIGASVSKQASHKKSLNEYLRNIEFKNHNKASMSLYGNY